VARTKIRDKFLKEAAIKRRMAGRVQQMAQNWVESPLTELLIMLLVILDISLTVVEAGSAKAEVRHTLSRSHIRHTLSRSHMRPPSQPRSCAHPPTHYPPPAERGSLWLTEKRESHHVQELAHVDNPVMVMTGVILMVFVFESIVRVFGFRGALFNGSRILDFADVIVVVISVAGVANMLLMCC
jgi:hypothetical protein